VILKRVVHHPKVLHLYMRFHRGPKSTDLCPYSYMRSHDASLASSAVDCVVLS
jgi:hypothetical protein